jgi:uncharacterized protein (TIGR02246 family)
MKTVDRVCLAAVAAMMAAACVPLKDIYNPEPPPIAYGPATERQVERALQRYSKLFAAMDGAGVAQMYTPDGVWERQAGPLYGRDAIRDAIMSTGGVRVLSYEMTTLNMSYMGPALSQTGEFKQALRLANGKTVNVDGRFEATWVQNSSGEWLVQRMVTRANK